MSDVKRGPDEAREPGQAEPDAKRARLEQQGAPVGLLRAAGAAEPAAAAPAATRETAPEAPGPAAAAPPPPAPASGKEEPPAAVRRQDADAAAPDQARAPAAWDVESPERGTAAQPPAHHAAHDALVADAPALPGAAAAPAAAAPAGPEAAGPADAPMADADADAVSEEGPSVADGGDERSGSPGPSATGGAGAGAGAVAAANPGAAADADALSPGAAADAAAALQQLLASAVAGGDAAELPPGAQPLLLSPELIAQLTAAAAGDAEAAAAAAAAMAAAGIPADLAFAAPLPPLPEPRKKSRSGTRRPRTSSSGGGGGDTAAARLQRRKNTSPSTSSYKGVTRHRRTGRWEAHIWDGASPAAGGDGTSRPGGRGKQLYLGSYDTELDAARVYDRAALAFFKRKAVLNFAIEDYEEELPGLLAIPDRNQAVQLIRSRYRSSSTKGRSSTFRGVSLHASGRWEARITLGAGADRRYKGSQFLGLFDTQEQAAAAYDAAAMQLHGHRAVLNFEDSARTNAAAAMAALAAAEGAGDAGAAAGAAPGQVAAAAQPSAGASSIKALVAELNALEQQAGAARAAAATDEADARAAAPAPAAASLAARAPARAAPKAKARLQGPGGAQLPPWGGGDAGRSPPRDEADPLVMAAKAAAAANAAAKAVAAASGSIAASRQRRANAGKRLTRYGSEDYEADENTLDLLAEQSDESEPDEPAEAAAGELDPFAPFAAAPFGGAAGLDALGAVPRRSGARRSGARPGGGAGDALLALAAAAGVGIPGLPAVDLGFEEPLFPAAAGPRKLPAALQLPARRTSSVGAEGLGGAAAANGNGAAAAGQSGALLIDPVDAAAVAKATAAALARAAARSGTWSHHPPPPPPRRRGGEVSSADGPSAAASGSTGGAGPVGRPRLPLLPDIEFTPGEVTDPKAKSLAVNGVLSLMKALDVDSSTRGLVFKALNLQLADPASAAHFLSVPYQFIRWCCSEGDADAARTALSEIADGDAAAAAAR
ncbi:AP2-like ethylene-responsive transcription factor [Raphidocelis subcapitata]|uniref:AP2-like ethylene-responsive transcription factor n=1 Tax=Raphidocelis subcapitata TaxID=307507 RepID=A0A2V0P5S3_9CHLO|nr:AP2-like ethylene-responsive transcription factor [Raphidocelis subcapitata]|eukprot:GBF94282.1 AP2-like ethylene-responsive transcription factor [Raphidocelis subcapitata]